MGYVCNCTDRDPICEAEKRLMAEVKANPDAFERLKAKARWEGMSLSAILREWGDPRTWDKREA